MATKSELQQKLEDLRGALASASTPDSAKTKLQAEINKTEAELLTMPDEDNNEPESDQSVIDKIASVLLTTMSSGKGSGLDAPQLRQFITDYLRTDKVKLSELDQSVLDEIRKNQLIKIQLPLYDKEIEVDSATADIPNLYKIIDDILAGNNVFLVGEAGGGKTYTAEKVAEILQRKYVTLNCSQYTSPLEILGGQSVEGFKQGKLVDCWRNGKILILDEMPKLDPNTAGLFNDALAKSTKTKTKSQAKINSTNAEEPPIERNSDFGIIATGNLYPNIKPPSQYGGNSQQDLSLLDRFSGSVYYTEFDNKTDQRNTRYQFLYEFLVGNYYDYIKAKNEGSNLPTPVGLRAIIEHNGWGNLALVSYRTGTSFRIAFEYELVRYMAKKKGNDVLVGGKTLLSTFKSYMVAFGRESGATYQEVIRQTQYTDDYIQNIVDKAIKGITKDSFGFIKSLTPIVQEGAKGIFESYDDFFTSNVKIESKA